MNRESLITTEEKLLFDILQELKEINCKLTPYPVAKGTAKAKEPTKEGVNNVSTNRRNSKRQSANRTQ